MHFLGQLEQSAINQGLKTTKMCFLTALEARGLQSGCQQGRALSEGCRGVLAACPGSWGFLVLLGLLACSCMPLVPARGQRAFSWVSLSSHEDSGCIVLGATLLLCADSS